VFHIKSIGMLNSLFEVRGFQNQSAHASCTSSISTPSMETWCLRVSQKEVDYAVQTSFSLSYLNLDRKSRQQCVSQTPERLVVVVLTDGAKYMYRKARTALPRPVGAST